MQRCGPVARATRLFLLALGAAFAQEYTISTVAGGSPPPTPARGTTLSIYPPAGMALDSSGNVFFSSLNCIFRLDREGIVTRVAGNGRYGFSGDGGPAIHARFSMPGAVAMDAHDNLYVLDGGNYRVRRISADGVITTVAGNGTNYPFGPNGDGGPATSAVLALAVGLAVDGEGSLYIAELVRIRKVAPDGMISTVAGGSWDLPDEDGPATSVSLNNAAGLAVDAEGTLFISERVAHRIRRLSRDGILTTVLGGKGKGLSGDGGPAIEAQVAGPLAMAVDGEGNLLIVDQDNYRVRKISPSGMITTFAGGGTTFPGDAVEATSANLFRPCCVAVDKEGNVFLAAGWIQKIASDGIISIVSGNGTYSYGGDGGPATAAQLYGPGALALDAEGNLFIVDSGNLMIRRVGTDGVISTIAGTGKFGSSGDGGPARLASFGALGGLAFDASGNLFVADVWSHRIRKISPGGIITTAVGDGFPRHAGDGGPASKASINYPLDIAFDRQGNLFIADYGNERIRKVSPDGVIETVAGTGGRGFSGDGGPGNRAQVSGPNDLAVDADGNLYFTDIGNQRIRKISVDGTISTIAGNGEFLSAPDGAMAATSPLIMSGGLAADGEGNLWFGEHSPARVRRISRDGILTTVAGGGTSADDGISARQALLLSVDAFAMDPAGRMYVSTTGTVRLLEPIRQ